MCWSSDEERLVCVCVYVRVQKATFRIFDRAFLWSEPPFLHVWLGTYMYGYVVQADALLQFVPATPTNELCLEYRTPQEAMLSKMQLVNQLYVHQR